MTLEFKDLAWIIGIVGLLAGSLIAFVKLRLTGGDGFARASDVTALSAKVSSLEQLVQRGPSHEDIRGLQARIATVETHVAVVGEKVSSVKEITVRVEHQLNLVAQALAQEGR